MTETSGNEKTPELNEWKNKVLQLLIAQKSAKESHDRIVAEFSAKLAQMTQQFFGVTGELDTKSREHQACQENLAEARKRDEANREALLKASLERVHIDRLAVLARKMVTRLCKHLSLDLFPLPSSLSRTF